MSFAQLFFNPDADFDKVLSARLPPVIHGALNNLSGRVIPKFDIIQRDDKVVVFAELPGVQKEDVTVSLVNDRLTISGSTKEDHDYVSEDPEAKLKVTHRERSFGDFTRELQVPLGIKSEEIKASMENGVLKIILPAKPKEPESSHITIS